MNEKKLNDLFDAAKRELPAAPTYGFELLVMQQISRNPRRTELTVSDLLDRWFPRLALATAAVIALCIIGDLVYSSDGPSLSDSAAQLSEPTLAEN